MLQPAPEMQGLLTASEVQVSSPRAETCTLQVLSKETSPDQSQLRVTFQNGGTFELLSQGNGLFRALLQPSSEQPAETFNDCEYLIYESGITAHN